jgi:hypothetical protein
MLSGTGDVSLMGMPLDSESTRAHVPERPSAFEAAAIAGDTDIDAIKTSRQAWSIAFAVGGLVMTSDQSRPASE